MRYLAIDAISKDTPTYRVAAFSCPVQTCAILTNQSYFSAAADLLVLGNGGLTAVKRIDVLTYTHSRTKSLWTNKKHAVTKSPTTDKVLYQLCTGLL